MGFSNQALEVSYTVNGIPNRIMKVDATEQ